jgi:hypothetical protein
MEKNEESGIDCLCDLARRQHELFCHGMTACNHMVRDSDNRLKPCWELDPPMCVVRHTEGYPSID